MTFFELKAYTPSATLMKSTHLIVTLVQLSMRMALTPAPRSLNVLFEIVTLWQLRRTIGPDFLREPNFTFQ